MSPKSPKSEKKVRVHVFLKMPINHNDNTGESSLIYLGSWRAAVETQPKEQARSLKANIKKLFSKLEEAKSQPDKDKVLSELQPVITYANIAVDEFDFGTGLEVGIDMFCSGLKELEASALNSLCSVYSLLNRAQFGTIIQAHLKCRRKGPDMSVLSIGNK